VHSVARQAHVDATIADIAGVLQRRIEQEIGDAEASVDDAPIGEGIVVTSDTSGYVQGIDRDRAFEIACAENLSVDYSVRSGDYIVAELPLLRLISERKASDDTLSGLRGTVTIGAQRIDAEDLRFQCLLLVEIALRALSPGVNDPFTAVACIDNLSGVLAKVNGRDLTPDPLVDNNGTVRVRSKELTYQDFVDAIFHPLRQAGARVPTVAICLLERLRDLVRVTDEPDAREHLVRHAELIATAARDNTTDAADEDSFKSRLEKVQQESKS
jgi:uncharacterized membrane protein